MLRGCLFESLSEGVIICPKLTLRSLWVLCKRKLAMREEGEEPTDDETGRLEELGKGFVKLTASTIELYEEEEK